MAVVTTIVIVFSLSYTLALFITSRRRRRPSLPPSDDLFFVFLLPCLNEEVVIGRSLERLLAFPGDNFAALVIDDGSEDRTSDIVRSFARDHIWLLRRDPPNARQGKGEALNHALQYLRTSGLLQGRRHEDVIIVVVDADGRVAPNALFEIAPYFRDPKAGAVQIGVRMYNADESLLARMQDFEFVTFTEIFQRARQRVGSVGLGGNGQFARLTALESLGEAPWTDCLTEDLDLGVRLLTLGYSNNFCPTTHVSQQAVTSVRRLVRQRSRWFQGHLQCWKRIPLVLRSNLPPRTTFDLVYHLTSPALVLLMTLPIVSFFVALIFVAINAPGELLAAMVARGGLLIAAWYLLSFGLTPFYGFVYWLRDRSTSLPKAIAYAHVFTLYAYMWLPAGWWAVGRVLRRKRGWAKTARTPEAPTAAA